MDFNINWRDLGMLVLVILGSVITWNVSEFNNKIEKITQSTFDTRMSILEIQGSIKVIEDRQRRNISDVDEIKREIRDR